MAGRAEDTRKVGCPAAGRADGSGRAGQMLLKFPRRRGGVGVVGKLEKYVLLVTRWGTQMEGFRGHGGMGTEKCSAEGRQAHRAAFTDSVRRFCANGVCSIKHENLMKQVWGV